MPSVDTLEKVLLDVSSGADRLMGMVHGQQKAVQDLQSSVAFLNGEVNILTFSSSALESLLKAVSVESLTTIEKLITYGLQVVFHDQNLAFKTEISTKRNVQWLELKLINKGVEAPILSSFGGGPASVCAFLLRLLVCRRLGLAPVLLLDEPFSFVSDEYVENVGKLLRELTDKLGFTMILVTHDARFISQATRSYRAKETSGGTIFQAVKADV